MTIERSHHCFRHKYTHVCMCNCYELKLKFQTKDKTVFHTCELMNALFDNNGCLLCNINWNHSLESSGQSIQIKYNSHIHFNPSYITFSEIHRQDLVKRSIVNFYKTSVYVLEEGIRGAGEVFIPRLWRGPRKLPQKSEPQPWRSRRKQRRDQPAP